LILAKRLSNGFTLTGGVRGDSVSSLSDNSLKHNPKKGNSGGLVAGSIAPEVRLEWTTPQEFSELKITAKISQSAPVEERAKVFNRRISTWKLRRR
jgi:hypothetical protein